MGCILQNHSTNTLWLRAATFPAPPARNRYNSYNSLAKVLLILSENNGRVTDQLNADTSAELFIC